MTDPGALGSRLLAAPIVVAFAGFPPIRLLTRAREVLKPGGSVAVLDLFTRPAGKRPDASAYLGLFFHRPGGHTPARRDDRHATRAMASAAVSSLQCRRVRPGAATPAEPHDGAGRSVISNASRS